MCKRNLIILFSYFLVNFLSIDITVLVDNRLGSGRTFGQPENYHPDEITPWKASKKRKQKIQIKVY